MNLAPLSALYDTWKTQWETQQTAYLLLKQLKARIGALRRRLKGDLAGRETTTPSPLADQVSALQTRCETLPPTKSLTSLEEAKRVFQELHALTQEAQALWQPSLFPPQPPQETPTVPASETTSAGQETSKNVLLGGRKRPTHRRDQLKQKKTYVASASQMERAGEQEKREKQGPPTPPQVEPRPAVIPAMTPEEEKTAAQEILTPERLAVLLLDDQAPETWNELLAAVNARVQTQAEDLSERTWQLALEQMGVLRALLCLGLALYKHREGRARSPGAYLYGLMRRHQAGELKLEPWLRQLRHLTPPPMGAEGGVDYTLENDAWYQLQKQRTEAHFARYEEHRRQCALERQEQAGQDGTC